MSRGRAVLRGAVLCSCLLHEAPPWICHVRCRLPRRLQAQSRAALHLPLSPHLPQRPAHLPHRDARPTTPALQVRRTWWRGNNDEFLGRVARLAEKRKWGQLVRAFRAALDKVAAAEAAQQGGPLGEREAQQAHRAEGGDSKKQKRSGKQKKGGAGAAVSAEALREWRAFSADLAAAEAAATAAEGGFAFAFVEGALVKAVREGWWLLLDEMNLAPAEVGARRPAGVVVTWAAWRAGRAAAAHRKWGVNVAQRQSEQPQRPACSVLWHGTPAMSSARGAPNRRRWSASRAC